MKRVEIKFFPTLYEKGINMRSVILIAISLAGMTMFSGCKKDPNYLTAPVSVENFTAKSDDRKVSLYWDIPSDDRALEITGFEITMDNWKNKVTKTASQFSHTYTGLVNHREYTFKLRTLNVNRVGSESTLTAMPYPSYDQEIDGVYVGTHTMSNLNGWSGTPTIELKNLQYNFRELTNNGYYESGYGYFSILGDKIIFDLKYSFANFRVNEQYSLKGEYQYRLDGEKLFLSKTSYFNEYDLKKESSE